MTAFRLTCLTVLFSGMAGLTENARAVQDQPNIVVILADDFGVGDIQAHFPDNTVPSPYLDRLVSQGMSFTDAHSGSAVCTPTRYGLLTGRYAWRTPLQEWVLACYEPPLIAASEATLPGMLQQRGYRTLCVGKWHLGWDWPGPQAPEVVEQRNGQKSLQWDFSGRIPGGPVDRGFDAYFGVDLPNMPPFTFIKDDRVLVAPTDTYQKDAHEGHVMPGGFQGCPMAPDWQFDAILPELTRRAVAAIHEEARTDQPFFLYFSMTSPHEPVVPSEDFRGKSGIAPIADFLMETDWSAGQVIKAIDDAGIADNTIVIFTADNGHSHYTGWNELVAAGHMPSGPWRGHKGDIWEGGHRVPFVVRWPGKVAAGSESDQMVCLVDLFATLAEVTGHTMQPDEAPDSFSFLAAATDQASDRPRRESMINHSRDGEFAFRHGSWKLVLRNAGPNINQSRGQERVRELYHLATDGGETTNRIDADAAQAEALYDRLIADIGNGSTRPGSHSTNTGAVDPDKTQDRRWKPVQ